MGYISHGTMNLLTLLLPLPTANLIFRKNSDEIRGALRHRLEKACGNDVIDQIGRNEAKRKDDEKREQMWANQWENDRKVTH